MAFWKQVLLTIALLAIAGLAYARLVPGAGEHLARLGLEPSTIAMLTGSDPAAEAKGPGGSEGGGRGAGGRAEDERRDWIGSGWRMAGGWVGEGFWMI